MALTVVYHTTVTGHLTLKDGVFTAQLTKYLIVKFKDKKSKPQIHRNRGNLLTIKEHQYQYQ